MPFISTWFMAGATRSTPIASAPKAAAQYTLTIGAGESSRVRLRLTSHDTAAPAFGPAYGETLAIRQFEANDFYHALTPAAVSDDAANVMRQALAGMLW